MAVTEKQTLLSATSVYRPRPKVDHPKYVTEPESEMGEQYIEHPCAQTDLPLADWDIDGLGMLYLQLGQRAFRIPVQTRRT